MTVEETKQDLNSFLVAYNLIILPRKSKVSRTSHVSQSLITSVSLLAIILNHSIERGQTQELST